MATAADIKYLLSTEETLCTVFIRALNAVDGWTAYPETSGFDVLCVHDDGRQIGVEAKLQLNAKVIDQILPSITGAAYQDTGPDHRMIIVRSLTDANMGLAKLLEYLGIRVIAPYVSGRRDDRFHSLDARFGQLRTMLIRENLDYPVQKHSDFSLHDWNPVNRLPAPKAVPNFSAGVKSPLRVTKWKLDALSVIARLELQGKITSRQIAASGCNPSSWTRDWLVKSDEQGYWIATDKIPQIPVQLPEEYAIALEQMKATIEKELNQGERD